MSDFSNHSSQPSPPTSDRSPSVSPLVMVETAFLASTASLIWFINYYFPLGPLLRVFFSLPIALLYLRWDRRAAIMGAVTSGLLLTVLMGPTRSILYVIPYGWMGVVLGGLWKRGAMWPVTVAIGSLIGAIGFFFRYWLLSILLGRDLWVYATTQIAQLLESIFIRLGVLAPPSLLFIQIFAVLMVLANNIVYLFVVHLVSLLMLDRLKSPIPRPPRWVQILLDYDE